MKRSKWKGVYVKPINSSTLKKTSMLKISRNSSITPAMLEKNFQVYNGKNFKNVLVTKDMFEHKFGEFSKTRVAFEFKKKKKKKK